MNLDALPDLELDSSWLQEFLDGEFLSRGTSRKDLPRASTPAQGDNIINAHSDSIITSDNNFQSHTTAAAFGNFKHNYSQVTVSSLPAFVDNEFREAAPRNYRPRESEKSAGGLINDETPEGRGMGGSVVNVGRALPPPSEPTLTASIEHISPHCSGQQFEYGSSISTDPYLSRIEDLTASGRRPFLLQEAFRPDQPSYSTLGAEGLEIDSAASIDPYLTAAGFSAATTSHLLPQPSLSEDMNRNYPTYPLTGPALLDHGHSRPVKNLPARNWRYPSGSAQTASSESYLDRSNLRSGHTNRPTFSPDSGVGLGHRRHQARTRLAQSEAVPGLGKGKPLTPWELRILGCPPQGHPGRTAFVEASVLKLELSWSHQHADLQATMYVPAPSAFHLPVSADGTIKLSGARTKNEAWTGYQQGDVPIPANLTLVEVCQNFPNHVWGAGLRPFIAAHWHTNDVWSYLPENAKLKTAIRNNNYYQKAFCREGDKIRKEFGLPPRATHESSNPKRKASKITEEGLIELSDDGSELTELSPPTPKRRKTGTAKEKGTTRSGRIGSSIPSFDTPISSDLAASHYMPSASRDIPMPFQRNLMEWGGNDGSQLYAHSRSVKPGLQRLRKCLRPPPELLLRNDRFSVRHEPAGEELNHRQHVAILYDLGDDCLNEVETHMDLLSQLHWAELALQPVPSARRSILERYWMRQFPNLQAERKEVDGDGGVVNPMPYLRKRYQQIYQSQPTRNIEEDDRSELAAWNWCLQQFLGNLKRLTLSLEGDWTLQSTQTWHQPQKPFQPSDPGFFDSSEGPDLQGLTPARRPRTGSGSTVPQPYSAYGHPPRPTGTEGSGRPVQNRNQSQNIRSKGTPEQVGEIGDVGSVEPLTPERGGSYCAAVETPQQTPPDLGEY